MQYFVAAAAIVPSLVSCTTIFFGAECNWSVCSYTVIVLKVLQLLKLSVSITFIRSGLVNWSLLAHRIGMLWVVDKEHRGACGS